MKKALITLVALLAVTGMSAAQVSANQSESATVDVTVSEEVAVDIQPAALTYSGTQVGDVNTSSDNGFTAIDVENTGSTYIDKMWASATKPSSNPFGTGSASNYDAGNFMMVRPESTSGLLSGDASNFHYVNRVEYLWNTTNSSSDIPSFIQIDNDPGTDQLDDLFSNGNNVPHAYVGRFRAGNQDYYFVVSASGTGTDGSIDSASDQIAIASTPTTDSQLGTVDFTGDSPGTFSTYGLSSLSNSDSETWYVADSSISLSVDNSESSTRQYDVLVSPGTDGGTPKAVRTRYDVTDENADDLTTASSGFTSYLLNGQSGQASTQLAPGDAVTIETAIEVPRGVAAGSVNQGSLTFKISSSTLSTS